MATIETVDDISHALDQLCAADPLIAQVLEVAGPPPLRRREPGFRGLAQIVTGQQLSISAAAAIWSRLEARVKPLEPARLLRTRDTTLRACGLSAPKIRTMRAIAEAVRSGELALESLEERSIEDAMDHLCAVKGIGPWTAEIYLLFCLGHADIMPCGDLALQNAVQDALQLEARPSAAELAEIAGRWKPWRGVAARLFWSYYRVSRAPKSGAPV